jgi:hypothetical protein
LWNWILWYGVFILNLWIYITYGVLGCWGLILATFCKLGRPIYKPNGHLKSDGFRFGSEFSHVSAGLISHLSQFYRGSDFCSTQPIIIPKERGLIVLFSVGKDIFITNWSTWFFEILSEWTNYWCRFYWILPFKTGCLEI